MTKSGSHRDHENNISWIPKNWIPQSTRDALIIIGQAALFIIFLIWRRPTFEWSPWGTIFGGLCILAGLGLTLWSFRTLGSNLSPYPTPVQEGSLITEGPYRNIRHPIYTSVLLILIGWTLVSGSIPRMLVTILVWIYLYFKSIFEERLLNERFSGYSDYRKESGRFFPRIF